MGWAKGREREVERGFDGRIREEQWSRKDREVRRKSKGTLIRACDGEVTKGWAA